MCRGGIARNDECLDAFTAQVRCDFAAVAKDCVGGLRPVREAGCVAEVDDALVGKLAHDFTNDRETSHSGIEDADRRVVAHQRRTLAYTVTERALETAPMFVLKSHRFAAT